MTHNTNTIGWMAQHTGTNAAKQVGDRLAVKWTDEFDEERDLGGRCRDSIEFEVRRVLLEGTREARVFHEVKP